MDRSSNFKNTQSSPKIKQLHLKLKQTSSITIPPQPKIPYPYPQPLTKFSHIELAQILKNTLYGYKIQEKSQNLMMKSQVIYNLKKFCGYSRQTIKKEIPAILQDIKELLILHLKGKCRCDGLNLSFVQYDELLKQKIIAWAQQQKDKQNQKYKQQDKYEQKDRFKQINFQQIYYKCIEIIELADNLIRFWDQYQVSKVIKLIFMEEEARGKIDEYLKQKVVNQFKQLKKEISMNKGSLINEIQNIEQFKQKFNIQNINNVFDQDILKDLRGGIRYDPLVDVRPFDFKLRYSIKHNILRYIYRNANQKRSIEYEDIMIEENFRTLDKQIIKKIKKMMRNRKQNMQEQNKQRTIIQINKIFQSQQGQQNQDDMKGQNLDQFYRKQGWSKDSLNQFKIYITQFIKKQQKFINQARYILNITLTQSKIKQNSIKSLIILIRLIFQLSDKHNALPSKIIKSFNFAQPSQNCQHSECCKCYISYLLQQGIFIDQQKLQKFTQKVNSISTVQTQLQGMLAINIPLHIQSKLNIKESLKILKQSNDTNKFTIEGLRSISGMIILKPSIFKNVINDDLQKMYLEVKSSQKLYLSERDKQKQKIYQIYGQIIPTKHYVGSLKLQKYTQNQKYKNTQIKNNIQIKNEIANLELNVQKSNLNNQKKEQFFEIQIKRNIIIRQHFKLTSDFIDKDLNNIINNQQFILLLQKKKYIICVRTKESRRKEVINFVNKYNEFDDLLQIVNQIGKFYQQKLVKQQVIENSNKRQKVMIPKQQSRIYVYWKEMCQKKEFICESEIEKYWQYYNDLNVRDCVILKKIVQYMQQRCQGDEFSKEKKFFKHVFMNGQKLNGKSRQQLCNFYNFEFDLKLSKQILAKLQQVRFELRYSASYSNENKEMVMEMIKIIQKKIGKIGKYDIQQKQKVILSNKLKGIRRIIQQWKGQQTMQRQLRESIKQYNNKQKQVIHNFLLILKQIHAYFKNWKEYKKCQGTLNQRISQILKSNYKYKQIKQIKIKQYQVQNRKIQLINNQYSLASKLLFKNTHKLHHKNILHKIQNLKQSIKKYFLYQIQSNSQYQKPPKSQTQSNQYLLSIYPFIIKIIIKLSKFIKQAKLYYTHIQAINLKKKSQQSQYVLSFNSIQYKYNKAYPQIVGKLSHLDIIFKLKSKFLIQTYLTQIKQKNKDINNKISPQLQIDSIKINHEYNNNNQPLYLKYIQNNIWSPSKLRVQKQADTQSTFYLIEYNENFEYITTQKQF